MPRPAIRSSGRSRGLEEERCARPTKSPSDPVGSKQVAPRISCSLSIPRLGLVHAKTARAHDGRRGLTGRTSGYGHAELLGGIRRVNNFFLNHDDSGGFWETPDRLILK